MGGILNPNHDLRLKLSDVLENAWLVGSPAMDEDEIEEMCQELVCADGEVVAKSPLVLPKRKVAAFIAAEKCTAAPGPRPRVSECSSLMVEERVALKQELVLGAGGKVPR